MSDGEEEEADKMLGSEWASDCMACRGKVLRGKHSHWCPDWDFLPVDETCPEWPCVCFAEAEIGRR